MTKSNRSNSPTPERPKAVAYARVSSKEQDKEGFSIPSQQKLLQGYAQTHGLTIAQEYVDVETAKATGRTSFEEMIRYVQKHPQVRIILVEKTDRLYRNLKDWVRLDELDIEIHLVKEGIVLSRDSRSSEKFVHGIKVLMPRTISTTCPRRHARASRKRPSKAFGPLRRR